MSKGLEISPTGALTEDELNYSDQSLGANVVWKVTFLSSPQEPNVYNVRRKEPGILGIPGMQRQAKEAFLSSRAAPGLTLQILLHSKDFQIQR